MSAAAPPPPPDPNNNNNEDNHGHKCHSMTTTTTSSSSSSSRTRSRKTRSSANDEDEDEDEGRDAGRREPLVDITNTIIMATGQVLTRSASRRVSFGVRARPRCASGLWFGICSSRSTRWMRCPLGYVPLWIHCLSSCLSCASTRKKGGQRTRFSFPPTHAPESGKAQATRFLTEGDAEGN